MSPPQFRLLIDPASTGSFSRDLTADLLDLRWQLGMARPDDLLAAPGTAHARLRAPSRAYSPEAAAQPLQPGMPARILSTDGDGITRVHFTGSIDRLEPVPGALGAGETLLHLCGPERELTQRRLWLCAHTDVRADQLVQVVLEAARLRDPLIGDRLQIGIPGRAQVGSAKLAGAPFSARLQVGRSTFDFAADPEGDADSPTAAEALAEILAGERGRLFVDRSGAFVFLNRHYSLTEAPPLAAFSDSMEGLEYVYGDDVVNAVRVRVSPRSAGTPGSTLWQAVAALRIEPGQPRALMARFRDPQGQPWGSQSVIAPLPGFDFSANSRADGSGSNLTARVRVRLLEVGADAAQLEVLQPGPGPVYVTALRLRGTPLLRADPIMIEQMDAASIAQYRLHAREWRSAAFNRAETAEDMARWLLATRKTPRGRVQALHLSAPLHQAAMLERSLFDRIHISETQTGHNALYHLVAEAHTVDQGGFRHRVRWLLDRADEGFFLVGQHRPDGSRALAG